MDTEEDARFGPERQGDELPEGLGRLQEAKSRLEEEAEVAARAVQKHVGAEADGRGGQWQEEARAQA